MEDRRNIIEVWSKKILKELQLFLPSCRNEEEFRIKMDNLLEEFCENVGINPPIHSEYTVATGRIDTVFNRLIIEYERPGILKKHIDKATEHAIEQVKRYMSGLSKKERQKMDRLGGVVFDGYFLIFVRFVNGQWIEEPPVEVNENSLKRFLTWLSSLSSGIAMTAEQLEKDFSLEQLRTQNILRSMYQALTQALQSENTLVHKLFEQWRIFFSEAIDYSEAFGGNKLESLKKWVRKAGIEIKSPEEAERFFFVLHTYFSLLVKFIAWLSLSRHLGVKIGVPSFGNLATEESEVLRRHLKEMEEGGIFARYGILNLLEGDFFSWYLSAWNERIEEAVRKLLERLGEYDPATLTILPEETRDLFKKLYQYLLPREIRHNLGEYYTPDWLAQWLLEQLAPEFFKREENSFEELEMREKVLKTRFLDPACGSGTFLVFIISRLKELGKKLLIHEEKLLEAILKNVVGFDINPLAVLTARVNYLLSIADLLEYRKREITIPVYLADSVRTPARGEELFSHDTYKFPTAVGEFQIPAVLCTKEYFDTFCRVLEESVDRELNSESFLRQIERETGMELNGRVAKLIKELYEKLLELHRKGLDSLWARLLRNNFAPLAVGEFDYIVGNPPWVNWEHLPDEYRKEIAPMWSYYELFPHKGFEAILGKAKDDFSILMIYTVMDKLLKFGGRLGFVITQSVFKTSGGGRGFRRFCIGERIPLRVVHVHDMVALKPFEGASNRTAVMILEKGSPNRYPVPYTVWRKKKGARLTYDSSLEDVLKATQRLDFVAQPVDSDDETSPWITARPGAIRAIQKVLGKSDYEAHAGVYTGGANGVYWVEKVYERPDGLVVVRNVPEEAKRKVEEVTEAIEPDLLYPLLRGRDVKRWRAEPSGWILLTHESGMRLKAIPERELQLRFPRTYGYLKRFEKVLRERAAFRRYFTRPGQRMGEIVETGPFYSMFDVGDYTFAPWKVVWRYIASDFIVAVVPPTGDGRPVIPNEKLMLVACDEEEEAHYLCSIMNSTPIRFAIRSFFVETQIAPQVIERLHIPRYNPENPIHKELASLSEKAHQLTREGKEEELKIVEQEIDRAAAKLWGLTEEELKEIGESLRELEEQGEGEEVDESS